MPKRQSTTTLFITENIMNEQDDVTESELKNNPVYIKIRNA